MQILHQCHNHLLRLYFTNVESSKDQSQETSNSTVDEVETILQNNLNVDVDVPAEYDLYCTIHHIGALSGGHYVCAVRHRTGLDQGQCSWWLYNDGVLTEIKDLGELCSSSAYLLFYLRNDIEEVRIVELQNRSEHQLLPNHCSLQIR